MTRCRYEWGATSTCQIGCDWRCMGYENCPAYEPRRREREEIGCEGFSMRFSAWDWACALGRWLLSLGRSSARGISGTRRTRR